VPGLHPNAGLGTSKAGRSITILEGEKGGPTKKARDGLYAISKKKKTGGGRRYILKTKRRGSARSKRSAR